MVRGFTYQGERFKAMVHGHPGKEEIFITHLLEDDDEGAEISLDRFEDAGNDPSQSLESVLVMLVDKLIAEQSLAVAAPDEDFAWLASAAGNVRVHDGVQA